MAVNEVAVNALRVTPEFEVVNELPVGTTTRALALVAKIGSAAVLVSLKKLKVRFLPTQPEGTPVT